MAAPTATPDLVLDPMFADLLTPESAERLVAYRPPASVGRRLEALAEKAGEGELTPEERREYAGLIHALDLVTLFQLKARRLLAHLDGSSGTALGGAK